MEISIISSTPENYAMNPSLQKCDGNWLMSISNYGCSHFLVFSSSLDTSIDLHSSEIQQDLMDMGERLRSAHDEPLPNHKNICVSCIDYIVFRKEGGTIKLPDKPAKYAVCGCLLQQSEEQFIILMPAENLNYTAEVCVEISCTVRQYFKSVKKRFSLKTIQEPTAFYEVFFEKKSEFISGSIQYTIGNRPYCYPITKEMLGKTLLIQSDGQQPQFQSVSQGIILKIQE